MVLHFSAVWGSRGGSAVWVQGYSPLCFSSLQKRSQNHKTAESLRSEVIFGDHLVQFTTAQGRIIRVGYLGTCFYFWHLEKWCPHSLSGDLILWVIWYCPCVSFWGHCLLSCHDASLKRVWVHFPLTIFPASRFCWFMVNFVSTRTRVFAVFLCKTAAQPTGSHNILLHGLATLPKTRQFHPHVTCSLSACWDALYQSPPGLSDFHGQQTMMTSNKLWCPQGDIFAVHCRGLTEHNSTLI